MERRTKIVATLGPSSESPEMISRLIDAGTTVFRLNLKHSTPEWHSEMIGKIRKVGQKKGVRIGILLDLQGPEIRIGSFRNNHITLSAGQKITITDIGSLGDDGRIILKNMGILRVLKLGQKFYMDDGNLEFEVQSVSRHELIAKVIHGGMLSNNKSVNFPDIQIDVPVMVEKDLDYISMGVAHQADFFALSFVRNGKDVEALRKVLQKKKSDIQIIAKIERPQAVKNFDEILAASDGIMIGRGDLGIEIPLPMVPIVQKEIIRKCREHGKPVITATQMLESMITNSRPTRAEVSDIANAIMDGTDATMLSAESASGNFPIESVKMMSEVDTTIWKNGHVVQRLGHKKPINSTEAISQAVDTLSHNPLDFKAILLLTETGRTARAVAKFRPVQPIFAVTRSEHVANQMSLVWGVNPILIKFKGNDSEKLFKESISSLKAQKKLEAGSSVICVSGSIVGKENLTNSIIIRKVE